jgi:MerR family transcriptional regulator, light-induced transcriptional regulator
MAVQETLFSPKQVADALQVSESSVKRWCDRGTIATTRTVGGHRRIPLEALIEFLGQTSRRLIEPAVLGLPPEAFLASKAVTTLPVASMTLESEFAQALAAGDEVRCWTLLSQHYLRTRSTASVADLLVADSLHQFGEAWDCNEISIYQERRGCQICMRLIYQLRQIIPTPQTHAPIAIGAAPSGDPYQLPSTLIELVLREVGWHAINLGSDLPFSTLRQAIVDYRPTLFWLSVSSVANVDSFVDQYNQLIDSLPNDTIVIIGGRALKDELRPRLRYTAHCDNLRQLAELAGMMRRQRVDVRASQN